MEFGVAERHAKPATANDHIEEVALVATPVKLPPQPVTFAPENANNLAGGSGLAGIHAGAG